MTNFQVYKKILPFSLIAFFIDVLTIIAVVGIAVGGFFIAEAASNQGLIGLAVGLIIGLIVSILVKMFITNMYKAGMIAMITVGVTEGKLPDNTLQEGRRMVKERFVSIFAFFAVTGAIKGVFRQLGRMLNRLGTAVGGDVGNSVTSIIDSFIQVLISYLCDCCLGWVFYRKDKNTASAACEGAAIFFKHGKTLLRNMGRIFGMGLVSFLVIGGALTGAGFGICHLFPDAFSTLAKEIAEAAQRGEIEVAEIFTNQQFLMFIVSFVVAIFLWDIIHGLFIKPFVQTGVLRNFMQSGMKDIPTEAEMVEIEKKSSKFANLRRRTN